MDGAMMLRHGTSHVMETAYECCLPGQGSTPVLGTHTRAVSYHMACDTKECLVPSTPSGVTSHADCTTVPGYSLACAMVDDPSTL